MMNDCFFLAELFTFPVGLHDGHGTRNGQQQFGADHVLPPDRSQVHRGIPSINFNLILKNYFNFFIFFYFFFISLI